MQGEPLMVLDLLEDTIKPMIGDDTTLASAYQMMGERSKAKSVLQVSLYQHLLSFIGMAPLYFQVLEDSPDAFESVLDRFTEVAQCFDVDALNPNVMAQFYYAAALMYHSYNMREAVLDMLEKYTQLCLSMKFPLTLKGDDFFDSLDDWFKHFDLGNHAPRGEKVIKESMLMGLTQNPAFEIYQNDIRFVQCLKKLNQYLGGN